MKKGHTYITEAGNLLIITNVQKDGTIFADEVSGVGVDGVEYIVSKGDIFIGTSRFVSGETGKSYLFTPNK
jgi:hypothetical protein